MSKIIFFSGAGLSAESGLATFRANDGLWANYDINVVCNYHTWESNFELVHEFYSKRRKELESVAPNRAHEIIAQIQKNYGKERVVLITQNVDNLLERAGCEDVMHVHGELTKLRCVGCEHIWDIGYVEFCGQFCPRCKSNLIKPFVVFFYENAPKYRVMFDIFQKSSEEDVIVVVGTSGNVISMDMLLMGSNGYKILNNLGRSDMISEDLFDEIFYDSATVAMEKIRTAIQRRCSNTIPS